MSEHRVTIRWERDGRDFAYETYSRDHQWDFGHGVTVPASAAPDFLGSDARVDPEEAFVASISSCHMLTFLAVAARKRLTVEAYEDDACGYLEKNEHGKLAITRVVLRPRVRFTGENQPTDTDLESLHEKAHANCFIANSVTTRVDVESPQ